MKFDFAPFLRYIAKTTYFINKTVTARDCRIIYILSGKGTFESGGRKFALRPHVLIYCPYSRSYRIKSDREDKLLFYTLNFDFSQKYTDVKTMVPLPPGSRESRDVLKSVPRELEEIFSDAACLENAIWAESDIEIMYNEHLNREDGGAEICGALMKILLINIYRHMKKTKSENPLCEKIKMTVGQNPQLNIREIAERLNYHPFYLNEVFKKHEDMTLHRYIVRRRLIKANALICTTELPLSEIALECGFSSQAHLTAAFGKAYGVTPGYLRHKI